MEEGQKWLQNAQNLLSTIHSINRVSTVQETKSLWLKTILTSLTSIIRLLVFVQSKMFKVTSSYAARPPYSRKDTLGANVPVIFIFLQWQHPALDLAHMLTSLGLFWKNSTHWCTFPFKSKGASYFASPCHSPQPPAGSPLCAEPAPPYL